MATRRGICPTALRQLISYDPITGVLTWRPRSIGWFRHLGDRAAERHAAWSASWANKPALSYLGDTGYRRGRIFGRDLLAHRVAFAIMTGRTPDMIDHVNHNRADNRWCNLREADATKNARNTSSNLGSTSKYLGVFYEKRRSRWVAKIKHDGRIVSLGQYHTEHEAARAYDAKAKEVFAEFANLNFP